MDQVQAQQSRTDLFYVAVQPQPNGDHEVHRSDCPRMPREPDRRYIGRFANAFQALRDARRFYLQSNGCPSCLPECHTK